MPHTLRGRYLIHLIRLDGSSLFLHPFTEHESMVDIFRSGLPSGLFGMEPPVERIRLFRYHLYTIADHDAKASALDSSFLKRFIFASLSFLAVYLLLLVSPDGTLPAWFDPISSFIVAVSVYTLLSIRDTRNASSLSRRTELRRQVDQIRFEQSTLVVDIEGALHELEQSTQEEVLHFLRYRSREQGIGDPASHTTKSGLESDLIASLERRLKDSGSFAGYKSLDRWIRNGDKRSLDSVVAQISRKRVDLPLLALYWQLSHRSARPVTTA